MLGLDALSEASMLSPNRVTAKDVVPTAAMSAVRH